MCWIRCWKYSPCCCFLYKRALCFAGIIRYLNQCSPDGVRVHLKSSFWGVGKLYMGELLWDFCFSVPSNISRISENYIQWLLCLRWLWRLNEVSTWHGVSVHEVLPMKKMILLLYYLQIWCIPCFSINS